MARKQRLLCSTCKHVWRIEIGYYEESDHVIHGCKKPRKAKFAGSAIRQSRGCPDYEDIATPDYLADGWLLITDDTPPPEGEEFNVLYSTRSMRDAGAETLSCCRATRRGRGIRVGVLSSFEPEAHYWKPQDNAEISGLSAASAGYQSPKQGED